MYSHKIVSCVCLLLITLATGCKPEKGDLFVAQQRNSDSPDFSLSSENVEMYLHYKKIDKSDKHKRDRVTRSLIVRNALAEVVMQQEWPTLSEAQTHIKDRRNQILINSYFEDYVQRNITEQAVKIFYEKNKVLFADKKIKIAQIEQDLPKDSKARKQAVQRLKTLVEDLHKGADFTAAVNKHSRIKATVGEGGGLAWLREHEMDRILFNTAARLKKGAIVGPIETRTGLYVIKLIDGPMVQEREFEDVKDQVVHQLKYKLKLDESTRLNNLASARIQMEQRKFKLASGKKKGNL